MNYKTVIKRRQLNIYSLSQVEFGNVKRTEEEFIAKNITDIDLQNNDVIENSVQLYIPIEHDYAKPGYDPNDSLKRDKEHIYAIDGEDKSLVNEVFEYLSGF